MKATGVDTLPEEVLQCLFQHVNFQQRQATHAPPKPIFDLSSDAWLSAGSRLLLWCVRNGQGRFVSQAMPGTIFGSTAGMCWVPPQCFNVCLGLSSDVRQPQLVYYQLFPDGTISRNPLHIGPFASLLPCPHLTYLYISLREVWQGHLDLLAHLKHLQVLVVRGQFQGSDTPEHRFPGQLATVQTLRTLHITAMSNGISTVGDAISKLSRLEELHFVNCQVSCVSSALLQLHQLRALQICNTALDAPLVLPELSLLPKLANLAVYCDNEELPDVLLNCTQLTSFCFHSGYSVFDLPTGLYLNNLEELAVESYRAKPSLLKQVTKLQRLFLVGSGYDTLSQTEMGLHTFAMSVPASLQKMYASWPGNEDSRVVQNCILLNQLLAEK